MSLSLPGPRPRTAPTCTEHESQKKKKTHFQSFLLVTSRKPWAFCLHHASPSSFITGLTRRWVSLSVTAALSHLELGLVWPTGPTYGGPALLHVVQGRKLNFNLVSYWGNGSKFPWQVVFELLKMLRSYLVSSWITSSSKQQPAAWTVRWLQTVRTVQRYMLCVQKCRHYFASSSPTLILYIFFKKS